MRVSGSSDNMLHQISLPPTRIKDPSCFLIKSHGIDRKIPETKVFLDISFFSPEGCYLKGLSIAHEGNGIVFETKLFLFLKDFPDQFG